MDLLNFLLRDVQGVDGEGQTNCPEGALRTPSSRWGIGIVPVCHWEGFFRWALCAMWNATCRGMPAAWTKVANLEGAV